MANFPELMNELAILKNESITLTQKVSKNDDQIFEMVDKSIDGLECSIDVCNNPKREVQIPFSKIYSEDLIYVEQDELMQKVASKFNGYKKSFEDSSEKVIELINICRNKLKGIKAPIEDINKETDNSYSKFKEALNILAQPLSYIVEGFDVHELRKKNFKDQEVIDKLKKYLDDLKDTFQKYNTSLKGFNEDTVNLFKTVTETDNALSNLIEKKMLDKIKEIPSLLNKGILSLPETSRKINKFNDNIKKKQGDTSNERQEFFDKTLNEVLIITKSVKDQIFNSDREITKNFNELNQKVSNVQDEVNKKGETYNKYVKELKGYGAKIIDIVEEIRKLFDLEKLKFNFKDKNIEYPFYEYAKTLEKKFEEIEEIKKEVEKPLQSAKDIIGQQINKETLDLLFIMDITESMQDLLDETRNSIKYILDKIKKDSPGIDVRLAYEGYRDFEDLKQGEKYYTIDFEENMDAFKKSLDGIKAKGGGDDAEDVAGGLFAGLNMSWTSNARYAILIADAPGHGKQYHEKDVEDHFLDGDPNGHDLKDLMEQYVEKNINLCLTIITDYTDIMFKEMKKAFNNKVIQSKEKPMIQEVLYDEEEEEEEGKKDEKKNANPKQKTTMGDIVAKTAIEIYNQYSKKNQ